MTQPDKLRSTAYDVEGARVDAALKAWRETHDATGVDHDPADADYAAMLFALAAADRVLCTALAREPGRTAYEARFAGEKMGARGSVDAWEDLPECGRAVWVRVEAACVMGPRSVDIRERIAPRHEARMALVELDAISARMGVKPAQVAIIRQALDRLAAIGAAHA